MQNANFQQAMRLYPSIGISGQIATANPVVFFPGNPQADGDIIAGHAVWTSTNGVKNSGTGAPVGIVVSVLAYANNNFLDAYSMTVPSGQPTTIMTHGDIYVVLTNAVTAGQKLFASTTDGTFQGGAAGANIPGYAETIFKIMSAAAAGEITMVSGW